MSENNRKSIIDAITRMLARRDHARVEIIRKLAEKGWGNKEANAILQEFVDADLQSDKRYAEMRVRVAISKGIGQRRIRQELRQMQIADVVVEQALAENPTDWFELALRVKTKRFGIAQCSDPKDKLKQHRFLQYRGFDQEEIRYALNPD